MEFSSVKNLLGLARLTFGKHDYKNFALKQLSMTFSIFKQISYTNCRDNTVVCDVLGMWTGSGPSMEKFKYEFVFIVGLIAVEIFELMEGYIHM